MAIEDGIFLNPINIDRVFQTIAQIESERLGVQITCRGVHLKENPNDKMFRVIVGQEVENKDGGKCIGTHGTDRSA